MASRDSLVTELLVIFLQEALTHGPQLIQDLIDAGKTSDKDIKALWMTLQLQSAADLKRAVDEGTR